MRITAWDANPNEVPWRARDPRVSENTLGTVFDTHLSNPDTIGALIHSNSLALL